MLVALRGRQLWDEKTDGAAWDSLETLEDAEAKMWIECPWCGDGCELRESRSVLSLLRRSPTSSPFSAFFATSSLRAQRFADSCHSQHS